MDGRGWVPILEKEWLRWEGSVWTHLLDIEKEPLTYRTSFLKFWRKSSHSRLASPFMEHCSWLPGKALVLPGGAGATLYTWTLSASVYLSVRWGQEQPPYENLGKRKGIHAGELLRTSGVPSCLLDVSSNDCYCAVQQVSQSNEVRRQGVHWMDGMHTFSNTTSLHLCNSWFHSAHQWIYSSKCALGGFT